MLTFNENMTDDEVKETHYRSYTELGFTEIDAKEKAEADFKKHKEMIALIENPTDDVSVLEIEKGGKIIKKTGKFTDVKTINDL